MSTINVIPFGSDAPWFEQDTYLDATLYSLELYFNVRAQKWFLSVHDNAGNVQVAGVAVSIDVDLLRACSYRLLPNTVLFASDDSNLGRQPAFTSFQTTHSLCYEAIG